MADILSQDEINALMETYSASGGQGISDSLAGKKVRIYDFARPDKFSKDHLRSLNVIHTKHGAAFGLALASLLRTSVQVHLLALDQLTYQEYCASVPEGTLFVEVALEPLNSTAVFEFNPLLVSACVDLLAGGMPSPSTAAIEVTDIDKAVITPVVELALKRYAEAWVSCIELHPRIAWMTTEPRSQQVLPSEAVLVCGYEVSVGEAVSMMSICIPATAVEAVLPALTLGRTLNATKASQKCDAGLRRTFDGVELECHAVLGHTRLSLEEVVGLEVGDVIKLPTKANGHLEFRVGDVAAFRGVLGASGSNLAVQLVGPAAETEGH